MDLNNKITDNSINNLKKKVIGDINISSETIVQQDMFNTIFNYIIEIYKCFGLIINKNEIELKSYDDIVPNNKKNIINRFLYGDTNIDMDNIKLEDMLYSGILETLTGTSVMGTYNRETKDICLKPGMKLGLFVSVLAHELCHAYIHQKNIKISHPKLSKNAEKYGFSFENKFYMHDGDIEEGVCELMRLLIMEIIFKKKIPCSNSEKYWYGWRTLYAGYCDIYEDMKNKQISNYNQVTYIIMTLRKIFNGIQKDHIIESWIQMIPINEKQSNICHDHLL